MPTKVDCPCCSQTVLVPRTHVRKNWACPACGHRFAPDPDIHKEIPPVDARGAGADDAPCAGAARKASAARRFGARALGVAFVLGAIAGAMLMWMAMR